MVDCAERSDDYGEAYGLVIDHEKIQKLIIWMVDGARPSANAQDIVEGICTRLVDAGIPVTRFVLFIYTLHPQIRGRRFKWTQTEGVDSAEAKFSVFSSDLYNHNPLPRVIETQSSIRRKLVDPNCPDDYIIIGELREQGFTDYLALPLIFTTGETHVATWSTSQADGFSDETIDVLEQIAPPLARLTETYMLRLNAANLLSTYVGRNVGQRILEGAVQRGDGEDINAVILFVDFKNFTKRSNSMSGRALIEILNTSFDALVPHVEENGGEILKYLGDGFFAIFPYSDESSAKDAAFAGLTSVRAGCAALQEATELATKHPLFDIRTALHAGSFHYGNIGGSARLDFTAIGPSVNYTARLLSAATELGTDHVASEQVRALLGDEVIHIGNAEFKGFSGQQNIYGLK